MLQHSTYMYLKRPVLWAHGSR